MYTVRSTGRGNCFLDDRVAVEVVTDTKRSRRVNFRHYIMLIAKLTILDSIVYCYFTTVYKSCVFMSAHVLLLNGIASVYFSHLEFLGGGEDSPTSPSLLLNEVNARRARLQLGLVTVFERVYHLGL